MVIRVFFHQQAVPSDNCEGHVYLWNRETRVTLHAYGCERSQGVRQGCCPLVQLLPRCLWPVAIAIYFLDHSSALHVCMGGPGKVVQIDMSQNLAKESTHQGIHVDGHWVFGGIEQGSRDAFMMVVPDQSKIH